MNRMLIKLVVRFASGYSVLDMAARCHWSESQAFGAESLAAMRNQRTARCEYNRHRLNLSTKRQKALWQPRR